MAPVGGELVPLTSGDEASQVSCAVDYAILSFGKQLLALYVSQ
jgi:hypothetical protein